MKIISRIFLYFFSSWALVSVGLMACSPFQDSPFSDRLLSRETNINVNAMSEIGTAESDGLLRIAVMADSHQNYHDLDEVIYKINRTQNIDFVVNLGDFTNSSYNYEYSQFIDSFVTLRRPAFTVIGNHDSIGAGPSLFRKAFSEPNFWFETTSRRFIFFNSANLENPDDFDPLWLKSAVDSSTKSVIILTHCSLQDPERFTGDTATLFNNIIADSKVALVLNGHNHVYSLNTVSSTILLQAARIEGLNWLLLEIQGTQMTISNMANGETTVVTLKN